MTSLVRMSSDQKRLRPVCSERVGGAPELAAACASRRGRAGGMLLPAEITWQLVLVAWLAMAVV